MSASADGRPFSTSATADGLPISGAGGGGTPSGLFYGGSLTTTGNKMRTNGVSNDTTFAGFDAGSEWPMPQAGTLMRVVISRTNSTSDVTLTVELNGVVAATIVILAGNLIQSFDISVAVVADDKVAIEYGSTAGSNPDFTTGAIWWEA